MGRIDPNKMPDCQMARVILHWTAGTYKASALDRAHYHVLVEGDGAIVMGDHAISTNAKPPREPRASHTRNCNTGSIGVAVCCMLDARERPFSAGPFPMTIGQWQSAAEVVAELCTRYAIEVTPRTVLAHGEVQATLDIPQLQKWDPLVQPWSPGTPRRQVMDDFRALVRRHMTQPQPAAPGMAVATGGPASFQPQSRQWAGDSAVLLVNGVGNAKPGDYAEVIQAVQAAAGPNVAIYSLFYDVFNDWLPERAQFSDQISKLTGGINAQEAGLPEGISEFAGDVLWPIFNPGARNAIKASYIAQLRQMRLDGLLANRAKSTSDLKFSIVCHSLGCVHTYEVLHAIANDPLINLRPATDGMRFRSVVFMASPLQLLRTLGKSIHTLVPGGLAAIDQIALGIPLETLGGIVTKAADRWVSVTGDLDPIGGHFFRRKADWAYMNIAEAPETESIIDPQTLVEANEGVEASLPALLKAALNSNGSPSVKVNNPHSWLGYVSRHQGDLTRWFA